MTNLRFRVASTTTRSRPGAANAKEKDREKAFPLQAA
jgi:hypothetical protein